MRLRTLYLSFKSLRLYYFLPIAVLYVIIPLSNWMDVRLLGLAAAGNVVMTTAQKLIPIASIWWIFCNLREYIEGEGVELLYVYENLKDQKLKSQICCLLSSGMRCMLGSCSPSTLSIFQMCGQVLRLSLFKAFF